MFYELEHLGTSGQFRRYQGENLNFPPHLHRNFECILLEEGEMTITVDSSEYVLTPGQGVLIFPNQLHAIRSAHCRHTLFIFSPHIVQRFYQDRSGKLPLSNLFSAPTALPDTDSSIYAIKAAMYALCAAFDSTARYRDVVLDKQDLLHRIFTATEQLFRGDCTLSSLSKAVGYNPEYISRFFKQKVGIPFNDYLNIRRLSHAAQLLTDTDETILSCALESGFGSLRSFNRNFKAHYGITPRAYRIDNVWKMA